MKHSVVKCALLMLALIFATAMGRTQTVTVGPSGQYPTPCAAFPNLTNGETVEIDANGGVPYNDNVDCTISADNLTIVGVNGRPVMDGSGFYTSKGLWIMNGHDNVVDNIEFRNASGAENAAAIRIQVADGSETPGTTDGGNITVQHSYLHNINGTIILGANANQYGSGLNWYSSNPYITFQYDEFAYGGNGDAVGNTHNMYMGYGGNMDFTLQYSWTHDSFVGHTVKTRAPYNNILYDLISDASGTSSYLLDFCLGGSNYVVGNAIYKGPVTNGNTSQNWMIYADQAEDTDGPEYGTDHQDLHFVNNTVVDDPSNGYPPQFISISCGNSTQSSCPAPNGGSPAESVPAVIENNIFVGPSGNAITNQNGSGGGPTAEVAGNVVQTYSDAQLAADFVDWSHYDFHLASGSPAIQAGIYPPTTNTGASDPNALAAYEFVMPNSIVSRPTPSGSTMDAGAYSYPRVGSVPSINLNYTTSVTAPGTGTITITGLPTPPSGSYNYAAFVSENTSAIPNPPSADSTTGSITTTFSVNPAVTQPTVVAVDVYAMGAHAVANITVNPGPPVLSSVTQDYNYQPFTSVHLEGPAPSGGTVIDLSSSDPTYLAVPSTVTVPQGQISAETGSSTGSLWGQNPGSINETITATQGSVQKSVTLGVFAPGFHSTETEYSSVTGGGPLAWCVVMVGDWPTSGGSIQVTSDTPSVIPNQTITAGYGGCNGTLQGQLVNFNDNNFDGDIAIATNAVSTNTTVNVTVTLNGASSGPTAITVTPGTPAPAAPTNLSATAASSSSVNLSWTASTTSGVTYTVYRDVTSGFTPGSGNQIASGLSGTTYSDTGLTASTTYYYVVEAVDAGGNSSPSNQASATTSSSGGGGSTDVVAIASAGPADGNFAADEYYSGGNDSSFSSTVNTSGVVNPPPAGVYQNQRWGVFTYTIPGLTAGTTYTVRMHFAEEYWTSAGQRQFNVAINGQQVLTNFDILATAGGPNIAIAEDFTAVADSNGQITIAFTQGNADYPTINGLEIQSANDAVAIGAGQTSAQGSYSADQDYANNGTQVSSVSSTINTSNVVNPAPQAIYQTQRYAQSGANIDYTIPGLTPGATYTVRLHFAEQYFNYAGAREFDVVINGQQVLTNFDMFAAAGGEDIAIAKDFTAVANASGQITVDFNNDAANYAAINGIEIQSTSASAPSVAVSSITQDSPYGPGTTVHLSGAAPAGGAVVSLSSSDTTVLWTPATVTVPAGQTSAETGTQLGSWWGQSPSNKSAVLTATYNGTQTLTANIPTSQIHGFGCNSSPCSVTGGQGLGVTFEGSFSGAPEGGGSIQVTSSNTAVIPNQSYPLSAGQGSYVGFNVNTNAVSSTTSVTINVVYNGATYWSPQTVTVNP